MTREIILAALGRYHTTKNWKASTAAGFPRYCVFSGGVAITEPLPHDQATARMREMIVSDILEGKA